MRSTSKRRLDMSREFRGLPTLTKHFFRKGKIVWTSGTLGEQSGTSLTLQQISAAVSGTLNKIRRMGVSQL